jgi:RNA polymerase sigma factor (sigma-70 family)
MHCGWHRLTGTGAPRMAQAESHEFGALMAAANDGDAEAYSRLLHALAPLLRHIVGRDARFVGVDEIEDVVQNVLLSVHSARATYDPRRPFMPWLLAIAQRRIVDAGRRRTRRTRREVALDEDAVTFPIAAANTYGEQLVEVEALKVAIGSLPRSQREAVELLKLREMTLREAASETGSSIGALKVASHRAIAALRAVLNKHAD